MRAWWTAVLVLAVSGWSPEAAAQIVPAYETVRHAELDGRQIPVQGLRLVRDGYHIHLRSGALHLLAPLDGVTFGAVFLGEGEYRLEPSTESERRHLQLVTDDDELETLSGQFDRLWLLFTDQTAQEVLAHAAVVSGERDPRAAEAYEDYRELQRDHVQINLQLRIVSDLLNRPQGEDGVFLALVDGDEYEPALLAVDPLGISNLSAQFGMMGGEEIAFISFDDRYGGLWHLSAPAGEARPGRGKPRRQLADADHYDIAVTFDGRRISWRTTITFIPLVEDLRVLPLHLFHKLDIQSASLEEGGSKELGVIQEHLDQRWLSFDDAGDADVAVVFPQALTPGETVRVSIDYEGRDVVQGRSGSYSVRARDSWYPNLGGFSDLATYEMTFRFPRREQLVATGRRVSEERDGGEKVAVWRSDIATRVAGFNYGDFLERSGTDDETGLAFTVYARRSGVKMAQSALADAMNASRVATAHFGQALYTRLAISQQVEWNFGQSWPMLVFLPSVAMVGATERAFNFDGLDGRDAKSLWEFADTVGWHKVAHQWWGHQIGWESYRDQWISEGFSVFTAALTPEFVEGVSRANDYWERQREEIFDRRASVANHKADTMTQGYRLQTRRSRR